MVNRKARSGGRAARVAMRQAPVASVNPAPNGPVGGQYRPLGEDEIEAIIDAAFTILAEIGMGDVPDVLADAAMAAGATATAQGRLLYSRAFVEDIIAGACKAFTLHGRDPALDLPVGGAGVYFGTGGAAVRARDLDTGRYRATTLRDVYDFARLADRLPTLSWFTRCCIATEIEDILDLELNTAYVMLRATQKPIGMSFTLPECVDPVVDMFDMVAGGTGSFAARPFCKAHISPIISPLKYGEDAVAVAQACIRRGVPINSITGAQSGATGPATLAGMLALSTAETLAALVMVNVFAPGYPMIFGNWPFVVDLRSGAFAGSGAETTVMNAGVAQIGRRLGLPTGVAAAMADAKAADAQMGAEKAQSLTAIGLSGPNLVYESAGMMASLVGVSYEAFVLDNESIAMTNRLIRGVEVNAETLGLEAIRDAVDGPGHFLGGEATLAAMERDYLYPQIGDRASTDVWEEEGATTAEDRARQRARRLLAEPGPDYLDAHVDAAIRARFNILF